MGIVRRPVVAGPAPHGDLALMREALKHVIGRTDPRARDRLTLGRSLAKIATATTMEDHLVAYGAMGLGDLVQVVGPHPYVTFHARGTIEHDIGANKMCALTLGFLVGAAERVWAPATFLGAEVQCMMRGQSECVFQLRAASAAEGP